jgi:hypothetical protein
MLAPDKKGLAPELFLVLSTPVYNDYKIISLLIINKIGMQYWQ